MSIKEMLNDPLVITGELRLLALAVDHYQTLPSLNRKKELKEVVRLFMEHELISRQDYNEILEYKLDQCQVNYAPGFEPQDWSSISSIGPCDGKESNGREG